MEKKDPQIEVHYQKTTGFRSVFVSGAYGGASLGNGMIYMNLFTDRPPIPKHLLVEVGAHGDKELERESKVGLMRDVEIGCIIDLDTAKKLVEWLQNNISILEKKK